MELKAKGAGGAYSYIHSTWYSALNVQRRHACNHTKTAYVQVSCMAAYVFVVRQSSFLTVMIVIIIPICSRQRPMGPPARGWRQLEQDW